MSFFFSQKFPSEQFLVDDCGDQIKMQILFLFAIFVPVFGDLYLRRNEDSEVAICDTFDVCNIVHHQFWGSDSVEKLCKCPEGSFCPGTFDANDSSSLPVNIRTQMKFCSTISQLEDQLKECENDEDVIKVRTIYHVDQLKNVSASLVCNCWKEKPVYWRFHSRHGRAIEEDEKLFEYVDNFRCSGEFFWKF